MSLRAILPTLRNAVPLARATPASTSARAASAFVGRVRFYSSPAASVEGLDEGERGIYNKLAAKFPGKRLEVQDVSGGCGSFYAILISSPAFKGLSMIKQHKLVNDCLKEDIKGIHGLQLKTIPEDE